MGLLSGAAGAISADKALAQLADFLVESEEILLAFKIGRDVHALTSLRVLSLDVHGITGARKTLRSIAYPKVTAFTVETAGTFDADAVLTLIVSGLDPVEIKLDADTPIADVQRVLAVMTLSAGVLDD
ncbi:MAG: PH domain-containing protein [Pseudomonadota bacterium]